MQKFYLSQSDSKYRRIFFTTVDKTALQTRVTQAEILGTFTIKIVKGGATSPAAATPSGTTITEVSTTNAKGLQYLTLNAADLDTLGEGIVIISSSGGSKIMETREIPFTVVAYEELNAVRGTTGTALPNVAAEGAGGLYTRGSGAGQINQAANGQIDANVVGGALLERIRGILGDNSMIDNVVYGDMNIITSARIRIFSSAAVLAAAGAGNANGADGETYRYLISCNDIGDGQYDEYKITRQL